MKFEKIAEAHVDQTQRSAAEAWATHTLSAWAEDRYLLPGDELSEEMKPGQSKTHQEQADKQLESILGDFRSMTYVETQRTEPAKFVIYRFRGAFTKSDQTEVRMVYNLEGKIDGFWIKPWKDSL